MQNLDKKLTILLFNLKGKEPEDVSLSEACERLCSFPVRLVGAMSNRSNPVNGEFCRRVEILIENPEYTSLLEKLFDRVNQIQAQKTIMSMPFPEPETPSEYDYADGFPKEEVATKQAPTTEKEILAEIAACVTEDDIDILAKRLGIELKGRGLAKQKKELKNRLGEVDFGQ